MNGNRSVFAELKRRNVLRAGVLYAGAAWALAQGIAQLAPFFGGPGWIVRWFVIAAAIGFPFWIAFAWFYELTPTGLRRESEIAPDDSNAHSAGRKLDKWIIAVLALAVVLLLANTFVGRKNTGTSLVTSRPAVASRNPAPIPSEPVPEKSVAVLPFANMSPDEDDAYFADGLSEEIINALTRVPDLHVSARTSSFAFRGSGDTVPQIAARLRVATVLEGSVRRAGDHLRITAQLIRASDGFDLWSESYDRSSNDIIAIQEDVAKSIAEALKTTIDPKALAAMQRAGTQSVPAYDAYLRGLAIFTHARNTGNYDLLRDASTALRQAVAIDPAFADAYAQLANVQEFQVDPTDQQSERPLDQPYGERMAVLRRYLDAAIAHARDDTDREKYRAFRAMADVRLADALRLAQDYVHKRPNDPDGLDKVTWFAIMAGDLPLARRFANAIAQRVGPLGSVSTPMQYMLWARDVPRATQLARQALALLPDSVDIAYQAHRVLLTAGAVKEAAALVPRLEASDLPENERLMVRIRQACAEGRTADAEKMFRDAAFGVQFAVISTEWQELLLLDRTDDAGRLLDRFDTPDKVYALATFMIYPMFDARRYPYLYSLLKAQGIQPLPPQPEPYACRRPAAAKGAAP
jgi:TolB-like protein